MAIIFCLRTCWAFLLNLKMMLHTEIPLKGIEVPFTVVYVFSHGRSNSIVHK